MKLNILRAVLLLCVLCITSPSSAQKDRSNKELSIGEACPNFSWNMISPQGKIQQKTLADFKGKWVILDFWATWCGGCVSALPRLDSLQQIFKKDLVIIPITPQSRSVIQEFLTLNSLAKKTKLFYAIRDTTTKKYFPHDGIPFEVWIKPDGTLMATTDGEQVTASNIRTCLEKGSAALKIERPILDKDFNKPLLLHGLGSYDLPTDKLVYSSLFTEEIPGLGTIGNVRKKMGQSMKLLYTNFPLQNLLKSAFFGPYDWTLVGKDKNFLQKQMPRVAFEVKDSSLFFWVGKPREQWNYPLVCYELILPNSDSSQLNSYMQNDLNRSIRARYGIEASVQNRTVPCFVIRETDRPKHPTSKVDHPDSVYLGNHYDKLKKMGGMKGHTVDDLLFWVAGEHMPFAPRPFVNETGWEYPIDWDLNGVDLSDMPSFKKLLERYGFELIEAPRSISMLVFSDVDPGTKQEAGLKGSKQ